MMRLLQLSYLQLPFAMSLNSPPTMGFSSGIDAANNNDHFRR